jgi:hypothetical protein
MILPGSSPTHTPTPANASYHQQHHQQQLQQQQQSYLHQGSPPSYKTSDDLPVSPVGGHFSLCGLDPSSAASGLSPGGGPISPIPLSTVGSSRPQPARSPYEWMKKPSYQSQPEKNGEFKNRRI